MTDWVEWLLVDGPAAGQRVREHPEVGTHTYQYYEHGGLTIQTFLLDPDAFHQDPRIVHYRIGFARDMDGRIIRIGWCSGAPEPEPEQLAYWIRQERPVKVVAGAENWTVFCDFAIRHNRDGSTIQGACLCGWETETVPRRRAKEVMALVDAHMDAVITARRKLAQSSPRTEG